MPTFKHHRLVPCKILPKCSIHSLFSFALRFIQYLGTYYAGHWAQIIEYNRYRPYTLQSTKKDNSASSVIQSCQTLCDPMDYSTPGFPVHHQLPELAQTHVRGIGNAIQLSLPLLFPSPPAFSLSQHPRLFQ